MGRTPAEETNIYKQCRQDLDLTRAEAAELLTAITADRLEKIENGRSPVQPDEVRLMAEKYHNPYLCNYYCSHECPIGHGYVPEVQPQDISRTILELIDSLNKLQESQNRLVSITVDGRIDKSEKKDFAQIQEEIRRIRVAAEALQIWAREHA